MCDRYFVILPQKKLSDRDNGPVWHKNLVSLRSSEVKLHKQVFFRQLWVKPTDTRYSLKEKENNLKNNVMYMTQQTNNFGLLLTQCHWSELLTLGQGSSVMSEEDDLSKGIVLYRMLLKKDSTEFETFINALHMTGNHIIANMIEAHIHHEEEYENREQIARQAQRLATKKMKERTKNGFETENDYTRVSKQNKTLRTEGNYSQSRSTNYFPSGALQNRNGNPMPFRGQFPSNTEISSSRNDENNETVTPSNRNPLSRFLNIFR